MRLIFINRFFYPDHSATSQLLSDLAFGLREAGHEVTVVTSRLRYDGSKSELKPAETVNGVNVVRIWTSGFGRNALVLRAIDYLTFYLSAAWVLSRVVRRGDIVVAMTDPPIISAVAGAVARLRGARFVNWVQDLFPEVAEVLNGSRGPARFAFSLLRFLRNISVRNADVNVVIGLLMAERFNTSGVERQRIVMLPNWADTDAVRPLNHSDNQLRQDWNPLGKFIVGHSGNLGRAHDIETIFAAIALTGQRKNAEREILWQFIGGGAAYEQLRRRVTREGYCNVEFRPYQPRDKLSESLSVADVHLVSLQPALEGLIVPSKFYGIAAAARPAIFIGSASGELASTIERYGCGKTVASGDGNALVSAIDALAKDRALCREMGERGRSMCEGAFSKQMAVIAWQKIISDVRHEALTQHAPVVA